MNGHSGPSNGIAPDTNHVEAYANHTGSSTSTASAGPANGGYSQAMSPFQLHDQEALHHLYRAGFEMGNYADTIVHVNQSVVRLHALILSRSPYLVHLMSTSPQPGGQRVIYVNLEHEPEVTQDAFTIALGYLYSSAAVKHIRPENARAVLAAGCLLGSMDELCNYAYEICRQSITMDNINTWLEFVDAVPSVSSDGVSTPVETHQLPPPRTAVFGPYAQQLKDDVFHFLVVTLPQLLNVGALATPATPNPGVPDPGRDALLQVYARVPFDLFKAAVESPVFQIGSDQARFKFAKDAIELRKRGIARGLGAEETVVLAFGGSNFGGSAVHITRKMRKRPLWKVNS